MSDELKKLSKGLAVQKQNINYHANILNQFVENGYEVYEEQIELKDWYKEREWVNTVKIFYQKDYSSRPNLFFGINKIKRFFIDDKAVGDDIRNVMIYANLKEVMTSYFSIEIRVISNAAIEPGSEMDKWTPLLGISYVLLNRKE